MIASIFIKFYSFFTVFVSRLAQKFISPLFHKQQNSLPFCTIVVQTEDIMHCSKCGAEIREGAKFCNQCGSSLPGVPSPHHTQHTAPMVTPQNSIQNQSFKPTPDIQSTPQTPTAKPRMKTILTDLKWFIVIYVLLLLCCGSGVFFLGFRTNWILWKLGLR